MAKPASQVCYIIQARVSSKRVPRKMLRPFGGSSLAEIALQKVLRSKFIHRDNFFFAVHEEPLRRLAEKHGLRVFPRSRRSAEAETEITEIYEWHDKLDFDYVVLINGCAPFLSVDTIDRFIAHYLAGSHRGLFSVLRKKNYFWSAEGVLATPWPEGFTIMNTKFVEPTYEAAHCLYASRLDTIAQGIWMGDFRTANDPELFVVDEYEAFDIDYPWQFDMAESHYERHRQRIAKKSLS